VFCLCALAQVFVNPYGGHRLGLTRWEDCKVIFDRAGIDLDVVVTTHRNHAYGTMENATEEQLMLLDGIIVVVSSGARWHGHPLSAHSAHSAQCAQ